MAHNDEQHAVNKLLADFTRLGALRKRLHLSMVGIIHAHGAGALELAADRASRTAKAFSNGSDAALVVAHEHDDRTVLWSQVEIVSRHGSTL
jgi:hypothetical protein